MKIRHPLLIKAVAWGAALVVRSWMSTLRHQYRALGPDVNPLRPDLEGRYIYTFWHENFLMPLHRYTRLNIRIIVSRHTDGELVTAVGRYFGMKTVRGSTTRGGVEAMRQLLRHSRDAHLAVTPDGPRGPRRHVQPGVVYLAARTGLPVVPSGIGYRRPWRLRSWDRFAIPRPGTMATLVLGHPIHVPANCPRPQLEQYRQLVERQMLLVTEAAEAWAETGHFQVPQEPPALAG